jgi:O-antigen biosynthesis protein
MEIKKKIAQSRLEPTAQQDPEMDPDRNRRTADADSIADESPDSSLIPQLTKDVTSIQRSVDIVRKASITAHPNPIQVDDSGVGATTLSYTFLDGEPVEIHVGSPSGPLFACPDKSGKSETGKWVTHETAFFLQDVSNGKALTQEHTLAKVTVKVTKEALYEALYKDWTRRCEELRYDRQKATEKLDRFVYQPTISIIMPVYNASQAYLSSALDSVLNQYYPFWELCICDDASTEPHVRNVLEDYVASDRRIKSVFLEDNSGKAVASGHALELATGEFISFLDQHDEITPDALCEVVKTLHEINADLIYSDEDKLDADGSRCDPFFKPAWNPDLLLSTNYISHFGVYRKSLIDEIGGFRKGFAGSQDYDLLLRFTEKSDKIVHIPKILYHQRKVYGSVAPGTLSKSNACEFGKEALRECLRRRGIEGEVAIERYPRSYRVKRKLKSADKVSIIIPTRDRLDLLEKCVYSIERATEYQNYEIVIINNDSHDGATLEYLERSRHKVIHDSAATFNFSRLNNKAVKQVDGKYLLLLNNDCEVISAEWLSAMIEHAQRPEVGAVGAKLLFSDNRIQHAGVILGVGGVARHAHQFVDGYRDWGGFGFPNLIRDYSAVTGACLMIRRTLFEDLNGLDEENLAVAFNDVDLCLRLRRAGYLIVYTPYALLYHKESASRGYSTNQAEVSYMGAKWENELLNDPYYNPNLTHETASFSIDFSKPEALFRSRAEELPIEPARRDGVHEGVFGGRQVIISEDNLCAIGINFGSSPSVRKGTLRLHLQDAHDPISDLRVADVDVSMIKENEYQIFVFDPISDSSGTAFYFFVEYVPRMLNNSIIGKRGGSHIENPLFFRTESFRVFCQKQFRAAP